MNRVQCPSTSPALLSRLHGEKLVQGHSWWLMDDEPIFATANSEYANIESARRGTQIVRSRCEESPFPSLSFSLSSFAICRCYDNERIYANPWHKTKPREGLKLSYGARMKKSSSAIRRNLNTRQTKSHALKMSPPCKFMFDSFSISSAMRRLYLPVILSPRIFPNFICPPSYQFPSSWSWTSRFIPTW